MNFTIRNSGILKIYKDYMPSLRKLVLPDLKPSIAVADMAILAKNPNSMLSQSRYKQHMLIPNVTLLSLGHSVGFRLINGH